MRTALLVIDVQSYFLHKAPAELLNGVVSECQKYRKYDLRAFTVFKNLPASNFVTSLGWKDCDKITDTALPDELAPFVTTDNIFSRTAYSAFEQTNLDNYLTSKNIDKLVICGIDTDACVLATAFAAFDKGYKIQIKPELTCSTGNLQAEALAVLMRNIISRV